MIDVSPVESSPCEDDTTVAMPLPGTQEDAPSCDGDEDDTGLRHYVASLPGTQEGACSRDGDNNDTQDTTGGVFQETNESMLSTKLQRHGNNRRSSSSQRSSLRLLQSRIQIIPLL